jgi:rsbT co-antagonist protein RsbR
MGANVIIIIGPSSQIARTLVTIGVDLTKMNTVVQGGIGEAERTLGFALTRNLDVHH